MLYNGVKDYIVLISSVNNIKYATTNKNHNYDIPILYNNDLLFQNNQF